MASQID